MTPQIDMLEEDTRWSTLPMDMLAATCTSATLSRLLPGIELELSLLLADDARIAVLNAQYRDKPIPTNVLSWPAQPLAPPRPGAVPPPPVQDLPGEPIFLGDLALAWETCANEAKTGGKPLANHVTHLIVHGVLHLLGYDHETEADAQRMEGLEMEILAELGIPSPY